MAQCFSLCKRYENHSLFLSYEFIVVSHLPFGNFTCTQTFVSRRLLKGKETTVDKLEPNLGFKLMAFGYKFRDFFLPRKNILKEVGIQPGFQQPAERRYIE